MKNTCRLSLSFSTASCTALACAPASSSCSWAYSLSRFFKILAIWAFSWACLPDSSFISLKACKQRQPLKATPHTTKVSIYEHSSSSMRCCSTSLTSGQAVFR